MNRLKSTINNIFLIFFPKSFSDKYRHIGYSYPGVPKGWEINVKNAIISIEKEMWPQWYLPLFIKRLIHYLGTGNSVVGIKYISFYKLRKYLTNNQIIMDIKDKYAGLRIYGYFDESIDNIIENAMSICDNTCEICGSTENTKIIGIYWYQNLCVNCRNNEENK